MRLGPEKLPPGNWAHRYVGHVGLRPTPGPFPFPCPPPSSPLPLAVRFSFGGVFAAFAGFVKASVFGPRGNTL